MLTSMPDLGNKWPNSIGPIIFSRRRERNRSSRVGGPGGFRGWSRLLVRGSVSVMVTSAVGVYGRCPGRGRGPWTETTRRVDGDEVSMYAEPGAVVMRLVRRTGN